MTHRNTWKQAERRVAAHYGTERTPLSGSNSKHTSSDTLHNDLYIEIKYRKEFSVGNLGRDTREKAAKEGKVPVVVLVEKNRRGFWVMFHCEDEQEYLEVMCGAQGI